jgi:hypothetical protein
LTERGINRVQDISKNIANFNQVDQGLGSFRQIFSMRGLTNTSIYSQPATVFYVDDVAYSSSMTNMGQLFDIDTLTVYRSAQPAGFGKNAYAGAFYSSTQFAEQDDISVAGSRDLYRSDKQTDNYAVSLSRH